MQEISSYKIKEQTVMAILWTEDLAVGVKEIDDQHKELFERVQALLDACKAGQGKPAVVETIHFLESYVIEHFNAEEALQRNVAYPEFMAHKAAHDKFLEDVAELRKSLDESGPTIGTIASTNTMVVDWLMSHIKRMDKKLGEFIKTNK